VKSSAQSITSLGATPDEERRSRMIKYVTAMSIRMICFILFFFVHGWWLLLVGIAAIVLPYFGVVAANTIVRKPQDTLEQPGGVVVIRPPHS
jgi:predicted cobalt transporter CbtA